MEVVRRREARNTMKEKETPREWKVKKTYPRTRVDIEYSSSSSTMVDYEKKEEKDKGEEKRGQEETNDVDSKKRKK